MPRRNLFLLLTITLVSLVCHKKAESRYARMFDTFVEVMEQVQGKYLEEVGERQLFEGALNGMVDQLDPYSAFYAPEDYTEFRQSIDQQFGGVGLEVIIDEKTRWLTVVSPLPSSPASASGVLPGDLILKIDGESTERFTVEEAAKRMRGEVGQPVTLTLLHEGTEQPVEITMNRAVIKVDTVLGDTRDSQGNWDFVLSRHDKLGYVRVSSFGDRTLDEIKKALAKLKARGIQGLVLDLRNNAGGLLTAGTGVCDQFISSGRIVTTRGRDKVDRDVFEASGHAQYTTWPMVVLVNHYSASASEIVAACLQDHGRALIVGERTWGKGTVQDIILLEDGKSSLKLTTASYWRPSNKNIHRGKKAKDEDAWGVLPNPGFEVKLTDEDIKQMLQQRREREKSWARPNDPAASDAADPLLDPQLKKAVEYLEQKLSRRPSVAKSNG